VYPANRQETLPVALMALTAGFLALAVSAKQQYMMLYGDAVAHLGIARRIVDTDSPGLGQLGSPWLPLPHLLMVPFVWKTEWWTDGMAGAWPSLICFVLAVVGVYRLARRMMPNHWALVATAFFGLNANLLYLATTAMTEPLFLAILVWTTLVVCEFFEAVGADEVKRVSRLLWVLGGLVLAAVMTRYDGWILGAAVWCMVAWALVRRRDVLGKVWVAFAGFTVLAVAGPVAWFVYNHVYGHDWLDFLRGPYSAKAIDEKTSPAKSHHHYGWHNPWYAFVLYARAAQVDAFAWEMGWLAAFAAIWGVWKSWGLKLERSAVLLWLPLPFYVYSVAWGSVPIFIPQIYPHSYYNSRYGTEMLPALTVYLAFAGYKLWQYLRVRKPLAAQILAPVSLALAVVNLGFMLHGVPLVLQEAMVNSRSRLALETPLAEQLAMVSPGTKILMDNSEYIGALQAAGISLKQTIGPGDYYGWRAAMAEPGKSAGMIVSTEGDEISKAVKLHPEGVGEPQLILCTTGKPCVRIYQSTIYQGQNGGGK
jgi:4-amino-4-deoxy-L-arabinose transferase-like glycosyltransferase